jgi:hypothetical protein
MPQYVITRKIPGVGKATSEQLAATARKSNEASAEMDAGIEWIFSYIVADKTYCVYIAPNPELIKEHARLAGLPADRIEEVHNLVHPTHGK